MPFIFRMHRAFSLIFRIQHFMACTSLPGSNFAPFEEVKVPVSNNAPWRILKDLGWLGNVGNTAFSPLNQDIQIFYSLVDAGWNNLIHRVSQKVAMETSRGK